MLYSHKQQGGGNKEVPVAQLETTTTAIHLRRRRRSTAELRRPETEPENGKKEGRERGCSPLVAARNHHTNHLHRCSTTITFSCRRKRELSSPKKRNEKKGKRSTSLPLLAHTTDRISIHHSHQSPATTGKVKRKQEEGEGLLSELGNLVCSSHSNSHNSLSPPSCRRSQCSRRRLECSPETEEVEVCLGSGGCLAASLSISPFNPNLSH